MKKCKSIFLFLQFLLFACSFYGQSNTKSKPQAPTPAIPQIIFSLNSLNEDAALMDSAAARIFLRVEMADFLWKQKVTGGDDLAKSFVVKAVEDFQSHKEQIPIFYQKILASKISSTLRHYSPSVLDQVTQKYDFKPNANDSGYKQLDNYGKDDASKVASDVRTKILNNPDSLNDGSITFILYKLYSLNKITEANLLLDAVASAGDKSLSLKTSETFFFLKDSFLRNTTPIETQKKYFNLIFNLNKQYLMILQKPSVSNEERSVGKNLYQNLRYILPAVENILPSLHPGYAALANALQNLQSKSTREREEVEERLARSDDRLRDTISEAEKTDDKSLSDELWTEAAQLALQKKKFQLAVDCLEKVEAEDSGTVLWHDQFLDDDVTKSALAENDVDSAKFAVSKIKSDLRRATALLQIAGYYQKNNDNPQAQSVLNDSLKKIDRLEDNPQKVRGLCQIFYAAESIDASQMYEIGKTIVKTINKIPSPKLEIKPESEEQVKYVKEIQMVIAENVLPVFQKFAKKDANYARSLALDLSQRNYRTIAQFGVEAGTPSLKIERTLLKEKILLSEKSDKEQK